MTSRERPSHCAGISRSMQEAVGRKEEGMQERQHQAMMLHPVQSTTVS